MNDRCIRRVTATPVVVPIPRERIQDEALAEDHCAFAAMPLYVVEVSGDDGPSGWCDMNRLTTPAIVQAMGHALLGRTVAQMTADRPPVFESARAALGESVQDERQARQAANCGAGVEWAAMDWAARQMGVPLWQLWAPQCRDRVAVHLWAAWRTPEGAARMAREAVARGFSGMKFKAGVDTDGAALVDAVLAAVGDRLEITIDPNGSWGSAKESLKRLGNAHRRMPRMILEDPVYREIDELAELRAHGVRVARSVQDLAMLRQAVDRSAADCFNIGGSHYSVIAEIAGEAHRLGKPVWMSSSVPTPLGDLPLLHMACTFPACTLGSDQTSTLLREDDLLEEPIAYEQGSAIIPVGAGTGVKVDRDAIARYAVGEAIVCQ